MTHAGGRGGGPHEALRGIAPHAPHSAAHDASTRPSYSGRLSPHRRAIWGVSGRWGRAAADLLRRSRRRLCSRDAASSRRGRRGCARSAACSPPAGTASPTTARAAWRAATAPRGGDPGRDDPARPRTCSHAGSGSGNCAAPTVPDARLPARPLALYRVHGPRTTIPRITTYNLQGKACVHCTVRTYLVQYVHCTAAHPFWRSRYKVTNCAATSYYGLQADVPGFQCHFRGCKMTCAQDLISILA